MLRRERESKKAFVLIMVLWILGGLSVWLLTLSSEVSLDLETISYLKKRVRAEFLARGAIRRLVLKLIVGEELGKGKEEKIIKGAYLGKWIVYPKRRWHLEQVRGTRKPETSEYVLCDLESEDSKLPLNKVTDKMLRKIDILNPIVIERIISWRKTHKDQGGFTSVNDLLLVEGITPKMFFGDKRHPGLKDLFTTYTFGKIYINKVSKEVIEVIPGVDPDLAREIHGTVSSGKYFRRVEDLRHVLGVTPPIYKSLKNWVTVVPAFYRVKAKAYVDGVTAQAEAVVCVRGTNIKFLFFSGG
ncbi:MAG: hypothetical protein GXO57_01595 [Thermodesulfobacteria bacterium]|nr:hypothetical protein [Thermodesulfobacteriota bacterium]